MPSVLLDKPYTEVADALMRVVGNATREERTVELGTNNSVQEIVIEGDFTLFVVHLMDEWGGHLRFVIRDTEAKDDEAVLARAKMAVLAPELTHMMTAKAQMRVYRRQTVTIETIRRVGYTVLSKDTREEEEWTEVTKEFGKLAQREALRWE